jgi:large subunit ribosomal protein L3
MGVSLTKRGRKVLLATKVGMTQIFGEQGNVVPVTVLEVGPCTVLQVKKADGPDGYDALKVGFGDTKKSQKRPVQGIFRKTRVSPKRVIREIPPVAPSEIYRVPLVSEVGGQVAYAGIDKGRNLAERKVPGRRAYQRLVLGRVDGAAEGEAAEGEDRVASSGDGAATVRIQVRNESGAVVREYAIPPGSSIEVDDGATVADGDVLAYVPVGESPPAEVTPGVQIGVGLFRNATAVDVRGVTKGRGFQGVIRRYHFNAGPKSHGSKNVREPGSTGMHTDPGRVIKGKRMPGHLGVAWRKMKNLKVIKVDEAANLLVVHGSVPGPIGGLLLVQEGLKAKAEAARNAKKK